MTDKRLSSLTITWLAANNVSNVPLTYFHRIVRLFLFFTTQSMLISSPTLTRIGLFDVSDRFGKFCRWAFTLSANYNWWQLSLQKHNKNEDKIIKLCWLSLQWNQSFVYIGGNQLNDWVRKWQSAPIGDLVMFKYDDDDDLMFFVMIFEHFFILFIYLFVSSFLSFANKQTNRTRSNIYPCVIYRILSTTTITIIIINIIIATIVK